MKNIKKVLIALLTIVFIPTVIPSANAKAYNSDDISVVSENINSNEINIVKVLPVNAEPRISVQVLNSKNSLPQNPVVVVPVSNPVVTNNYPSFSREEIESKICAAFGSECSNALIIVKHESGFRQYAVSRTGDYGLFQLNCRWQKRRVGGDCSKFFDIDTNIRVARQIFAEQGWKPWTTKIYLPK